MRRDQMACKSRLRCHVVLVEAAQGTSGGQPTQVYACDPFPTNLTH
ncbi:hypothetical protein [Tabrizicola fusiformis]|nr:hypothetical protein [Tabrizicola sp. SY72]NTT87833.1 hypothetical protein [Tabrizicola sp. SY72]